MGDAQFSLRKIAIPAFGPTVLFGLGNGAVLPVIALSARDMGASPAMAGVVVALIGLGSLTGNIPAALLTSRIGERKALIGASILTIVALLLCVFAVHPAMLALGTLMIGLATSVFYLARQTFLIEAVPFALRARALSTLGGTHRIGMFVGPFAAAGAMHFMGLSGAYWVAIVALIGAGILSFAVPELELTPGRGAGLAIKPKMATMAVTHAKVYLTLGVGILLISAMRAARQIVIPLWADSIGLSPTATALIFGVTSAVDMLMFYPAGKIMDEYGRLWVALPCTLLMGLALALMPLTTSLAPFVMASMLLGFGNGFGSGIAMTLGADASPPTGRTEFLGIWRLISDVGTSAGPFLLSGMTALVSLGAGIVVTGSFGFLAAALFWRWLPHIRPSEADRT
ncbi:MFS transporter [Pusillimonas sp. ANT_WB101]|uniref:MFS transporter n=1 Tax=Pusillimonas sp. ANT_WB101 TaxID=2597356 RepID=UPI0011EE1C31|nr:MFS transporter [Pusillimonas sp. ANT_WB101]KAA0889650.1 MFS transporter [Pusillimonas sp. ANT_WB101]